MGVDFGSVQASLRTLQVVHDVDLVGRSLILRWENGVCLYVPLEEDQGIVVLYSREVVVVACDNTRSFFGRGKELLSVGWGAELGKFI